MNERIRQLAEQATELDYETFDFNNHKIIKHYKFDKEKFAELIVRECSDWVKSRTMSSELKTELLRHFGVKE
jgi:hypothetical protein